MLIHWNGCLSVRMSFQGKMIILDLYSEVVPQYQRLKSYYGQPYIWCMLHDFGGTLPLYGTIQSVNQVTQYYLFYHRYLNLLQKARLSTEADKHRAVMSTCITSRVVSSEISRNSWNSLKNFFHFIHFYYNHIEINSKHVFDKQISRSLCFNFLALIFKLFNFLTCIMFRKK